MRLLKEMILDDGTSLTLSPESFTIHNVKISPDEPLVVLDYADLKEVVGWLNTELNAVATDEVYRKVIPTDNIKECKVPTTAAAMYAEINARAGYHPVKEEVCTYDPGPRKAAQTVELKLGDPNLAYGGDACLPDGRKGIYGKEVVDIGQEAIKAGSITVTGGRR